MPGSHSVYPPDHGKLPSPPVDTLQLAKDIHRHWYRHYNMACLANDACIEAATIIDAALTSRPAIEPTQGEIEAMVLRLRGMRWHGTPFSQDAFAAADMIAALTSRPAPASTALDQKTVEACAKVVDRAAAILGSPYGANPFAQARLLRVAASIRALIPEATK